jgi:hypothetical protein
MRLPLFRGIALHSKSLHRPAALAILSSGICEANEKLSRSPIPAPVDLCRPVEGDKAPLLGILTMYDVDFIQFLELVAHSCRLQSTRLVTASEDDVSPIIMLWDLRNARAPEKVYNVLPCIDG